MAQTPWACNQVLDLVVTESLGHGFINFGERWFVQVEIALMALLK